MDFDDLHAEEDVHIVINVKDFKAIVTHAETLKAPISAQFSRPGRPLLFRYTDKGLTCEFILMTTGISQAIPPATAPKVASTRPGGRFSRQPSTVPLRPSRQSTVDADPSTREPSMAPVVPPRQSSHVPAQSVEGRNADMAPPPKPASVTGVRERRILGGTLGRQISQATTTSDPDRTSLFVAQDEDDELRWEPANHEEEPEQDEMLAWDANADVVSEGQQLSWSMLTFLLGSLPSYSPRCFYPRAAAAEPKSQQRDAGNAADPETFSGKHLLEVSVYVANTYRR